MPSSLRSDSDTRFARPRAALACSLLLAGLAAPAVASAAPGHAHASPLAAERSAERARTDVFKARFPSLEVARRAAITLHGNLLETDYARGFQVFELDAEGIRTLLAFGYRLEPAADFVARRQAFLDAIDAANAERRRVNPQAAEVGIESIPGYACYETVEETFAAAQGFTSTYPNLARWQAIGSSWQQSVGLGGYDMRVLVLTNTATRGPGGGAKPKMLITSAIHAREYTTAPLALAFARGLVEGHGSDAEATWLLDHHEVHLVLHANPDGRKKAEGGLSWRKNTNTDYCGATSNNRGADLNRNFSFAWNSTGGAGSSGNPCDLTYRGPTAASEPETQAIEGYARSIWADRRGPLPTDAAPADTQGIHIDLHSYSELVLWPWGSTATPSPNGAALQTLGRRLAWFNSYFPTQSIGLYPTDGTTEGPSYGDLGVAQFTFELGTSFFQSCNTYTNTIKPRNLNALRYAAKVARAPYLLPAGPEATGLALGASGVPAGTPVAITAQLTDARLSTANGSQPAQAIAAAEAFVGTPPWLPGAVPVALAAADGAFDTSTENVQGTLATTGLPEGRHLVYVRGTDAAGNAGPVSAVFLDIGTATPFTLELTSRRLSRRWEVTLTWTGAPGTQVDVRRNGAVVATTANDGVTTDRRGAGTWTYQVCAAGSTTNCSPQRTVTF
jgi:hypothetical protein